MRNNSRISLSTFEPSLYQQNLDIKKYRPETGTEKKPHAVKLGSIPATETHQSPHNLRELRRFLSGAQTPHRDGSGWLGRLDSNRQMSNSEMAFEMSAEFPLISERLRTRDLSPMSCTKR